MPVEMNGQTHYRTVEVCRRAGISKSALSCWIGQSIVNDAQYRDRKGWRLFTKVEELHSLMAESSKIERNLVSKVRRIPSRKQIEGGALWPIR